MITGAHTILYSSDTEADIAFFKNILQFPNVDAGHGWLIFSLPPSEVAVHPAYENNANEFFLMCDDINAFIKEMEKHYIVCDAVQEQRWGNITGIVLPGGGKLKVYEPKHVRP